MESSEDGKYLNFDSSKQSSSKISTSAHTISEENTNLKLEVRELRRENEALKSHMQDLKDDLETVIKDIKMLNTVIRIPHLCSEFLKAVKKQRFKESESQRKEHTDVYEYMKDQIC